MLTISSSMKGSGSVDYYTKLSQEDYYLDSEEPKGRFSGMGATFLGIEGEEVDSKTFRNLLLGYAPNKEVALVQNAGAENRQNGWDLTFNAPKSVSSFWSQATPELKWVVETYHRLAVQDALNFLEETTGFTRRGKGGKDWEKSPWIVATFDHGTSRELDPQLHSHAVVFNISLRRDGSTGSLVSKKFFEAKMEGGRVYQESLAKLLSESGLRVHKTKAAFELTDVPTALNDRFSTRRKQILKKLKDWGDNSAIAAKEAALQTRKRKTKVNKSEIFKIWKEVGAEMGWSTPELLKLIPTPRQQLKAQPSPEKQKIPERGKAVERTKEKKPVSENPPSEPGQISGNAASPNPKTEPPKASKKLLSIAKRRLFPKAPSWSPFRHIVVPVVKLSSPKKEQARVKQFGKIYTEVKSVPFVGDIQVRAKKLFPKAPQWSPASKLALPVIKVWGPVKAAKKSDELEKPKRESQAHKHSIEH